jgi:hypothetical protein
MTDMGDDRLHALVRLTRETLGNEAARADSGQLWPLGEPTPGRRRWRSRGGRVRWPLAAALGTGALALAALPLVWTALRRPAPLTFEVIHGTIETGGEIKPAEAGTRIQFSEGSAIVLEQEARTQVRDVTADGARIVLARGRARASFVPRPHARWQVAPGPYLVQVTGTVFDVQWSDENQGLDLWLKKGSVRVSGPLIGDGVTMRRGQHLLTRLRDNKILLENEVEGAEGAVDAQPVQPPPELPAAPAAAASDAPREGPPAEAWSHRLARGDFEAIVASAERRGVAHVLARAPRSEVAALADAARYTRRPRLAARALHAERDRFPGTTEGREAGFFLGSLADDRGEPREAISWYARYLRDDPSGSYAAQALGRKMLLESRAGSAVAHDDAGEYLRRFPSGPYADAARRIMQKE